MSAIASPNRHVGRTKAIRCVIIHTAETGEDGSAAEAIGRAFAQPGRKASAHVGVDTDSTCRYVADSNTAWAAPGANSDGLQLELVGRAGQTTGQWADEASLLILERAAKTTAAWCRLYNIPARRLTDGQLGGGKTRGIVGHADVSRVFRKSDHWDPGPAFPWASFLARVTVLVNGPGATTPATTTTPTPAPLEDDMLLFMRCTDDRVVVVGPTGVRQLNGPQWATWQALGYKLAPKCEAISPGPFEAALSSLGGIVK